MPLNALRAFAVAARYESFKQAAQALHVTPGAVSRQVRVLEERLGAVLFKRLPQGIQLTEAGQQLARPVERALAMLAEAYADASQQTAAAALAVSAPPSFIQYWLLPRLHHFPAQGAEITLEASQTLIQPAWHDTQLRLAVRYGAGPWPDVVASPLLADALYPVCSPTWLAETPALHEPADLLAHELLHVGWTGQAFPDWTAWFEYVGVNAVPAPPKQRYSLFGLALDQAIAGRGVVLASHVVVADRIASGVLVRPFGDRYVMPAPWGYSLILPMSEPPALAARFIDWLQQAASDFAVDSE